MNIIKKIRRMFFKEKYSGNQELAKRNLGRINNVLDDEYLDRTEDTKAIKELTNLKDHLKEHKEDYLAYYRDEYLEEEVEYKKKYITTKMKRRDYIKNVVLKENYTGMKLAIGIPSFIIFTAAFLPLGLPISIFLANYIPKHIELKVKPKEKALDKYVSIIDTINDKLSTIHIENKEEKTSLESLVAKFSLEIADVLDLINSEPYPDKEKEEKELLMLNREFLKEQKALIDKPETSIELKLVYTDYNVKLEEIKSKVLEKQKLYRSAKLVNDKSEDFAIVLPYVPTNTKEKKLMRYRVKN